jgi:hypothetical protein
MGTQATVDLVVDESGAVAGLNRFGQRSRDELGRFTKQTTQASEAVTGLGVAGTKAGESIGAGFQKANGHVLSGVESVRLMSEDLGVRVPRAMQRLIAQTEAFQAISSVAFGAFAALGAAEIIYELGKKVYELGEKWLDTGAAAKAYGAEVEKTAKEDFANVSSIEDAKLRIDEATAAVNEYNEAVKKSYEAPQYGGNNDLSRSAGMYGGSLPMYAAPSVEDSEKAVQAQKDLDKLNPEKLKLIHEQKTAAIELAHAGDSDLKGQKQRNAERQKGIDLVKEELGYRHELNDAEDRRYKAATGNDNPNHHAADDGVAEAQQKIDAINAKYGAENVKANEETQLQIRRMRAETAAMGLKGEAEILAQEKVQLAGMASNEDGYAAKVREIHAQTAKKIIDLHTMEAEKTDEIVEQGVMAALTGNARVLENERYTIQQIDALRTRSEITAEDQARRTAAAKEKANAELAKSLQDYARAEQQLRDTLEGSQLKGYSRIDAEDKKMRDEALKRFQDMTAGLKETDETYLKAKATYALEQQDIDQDTEQKKLDLHQKTVDEIAGMEYQAQSVHHGSHQKGLMGIFAEEEQQTAKIDAEYAKRVREAQAMDDGQVENHRDAMAKIAAAEDLRNAQMADQQNAMRDKLAGTLESAFRDPMGTIKDAMQHEMMEIIANWIMQLTLFKHVQSSILGGQGPQGASGGVGMAAAGSGGILGSMFHASSSSRSSASPSIGSGSSVGGGGGYYSGGSTMSYGGSYAGVGGGASGSGVGSTIGSVASDVPSIAHTVSAAHEQSRSITSPVGSSEVSSGASSSSVTRVFGADRPQFSSRSAVPGSGGAATSDAERPTFQDPSRPPAGNGAATGLADGATAAVAGYAGYESTKDDFKSGSAKGTLKGTAQDAMVGMEVGAMFGPAGAVVGAAVGAAVGLVTGVVGEMMGEGGRLAARDYYKKSIFPQIEKDRNDFQGGDFQAAISDVNKAAADGLTYMRSKWGGSSADWVNQNYLRKEQILAVGEIAARAKGGSQAVSMSAKQFHTGGVIDGFGDLATSPSEGFIHALLGEAVINPVATSTHAPAISAMQSGASPAEIASMYKGSSDGGNSGGDTHHHYNINAIDAKGFDSFLRNGGARQIVKHVNHFASQYAGDGISG